MIEIFPPIIQGLITVSTAFIILKLERWFDKRKHFKALYGEVESNLNIAEELIPLAASIGVGGDSVMYGTVFDLQLLHVNCFEDFKRSGYLISLDEENRKLVDKAYNLIASHNSQTNKLRSGGINLGDYVKTGIPPFLRSGGYSERLTYLTIDLKELRDNLLMR